MWKIVILQEVLPIGPSANNDTVTPKAASAMNNPESGGSKNSVVKQALDMLKESKKSDDDPKSLAVEGEGGREEPIQSKSEHRTEASGERNKEREKERERERERERDRDRERERVKARDRDRGRDSDRERERDEIDKDREKVKDRKHRSKDRGKDSGWFGSVYLFFIFFVYIYLCILHLLCVWIFLCFAYLNRCMQEEEEEAGITHLGVCI